jgi:hypothetical protein
MRQREHIKKSIIPNISYEKECQSCQTFCKYNGDDKKRRPIFQEYLSCNTYLKLEQKYKADLHSSCVDCPYAIGCERDNPKQCYESRKREAIEVKSKSDKEILEYLAIEPSRECIFREDNIENIAIGRAASFCDWRNDCYEARTMIMVKKFIPEVTKHVQDVKALFDAGKKDEVCITCDSSRRQLCNGALPSGWIGFPDIYMDEAVRRGIKTK